MLYIFTAKLFKRCFWYAERSTDRGDSEAAGGLGRPPVATLLEHVSGSESRLQPLQLQQGTGDQWYGAWAEGWSGKNGWEGKDPLKVAELLDVLCGHI